MVRLRAAQWRQVTLLGMLSVIFVAGIVLAVSPIAEPEPSEQPTVTELSPGSAQDGPERSASDAEQYVAGTTEVPQAPAAPTPSSGVPTIEPSQPATTDPQASSPPAIMTLRATLLINSREKGVVTVSAGANQCDVLQQALRDGLISSLVMRYNSQYKTEGVYVIDGIGDSNVVWWGYKVNGVSPPYGCSHVPVKNNDSVNWEYVGR